MENEFWNVVQEAINSGNYQKLNQQVQNTIDDTVEGFRKNMYVGTRYQKSAKPGYQAGGQRINRAYQVPAIYTTNPAGKNLGLVLAIIGYTMTGIFGLNTMTFSMSLLFHPTLFEILGMVVLSVFTIGSLCMGVLGSSMRNLALRFQQYANQIGNRTYCTIDELSERTGRKREAVIRDLKKMIQKRMFLQGHFDQQETCVILTDEMYQQYQVVQEQAMIRQQQEEAVEEKRSQMPEECQKILEEGERYIRYIHECNDRLPGEKISEKLSRLELIITRIFEEVGKNPGLAGELRKFMNYYLPTTKKLIDAYMEMDREPIVSLHIENTKKEIEDTLDTINQAFENLLSSFFKEKAMDISSDISVLQTMLAQEGLTKNEFERLREKEKSV